MTTTAGSSRPHSHIMPSASRLSWLSPTACRCCKLAKALPEAQADKCSRSAVITGILAPSGPNRTRVLAALNKDERVQSSLPPFMSTMLTKTFNDYIIRPAELKEFEAGLEQHQRATGAKGETLLQRAIRDHNVGACGKVSVMSDRTAHGSPI
jgi:hypothetical protein